MMNSLITSHSVLDFWLGDGLELGWPSQDMGKRWFTGGAALDLEIKTRFEDRVNEAMAGGLADWQNTPLSQLALIILLDQFTRNVYRGEARAFAGDIRAQQLVADMLAAGGDRTLPWVGRVFAYMPLMHAEDVALQDASVAQFERLVNDAPNILKARLQGNLDFARQHQEIIARFGRLPYRNAVLGRVSKAEEETFLKNGPRFGQ
jgi:uncharacterized protein (DUF924 family)